MTDELHPIQREMLRIEESFEQDAPAPGPPIDRCIAKMIEFEGSIDAELDPILVEEAKRCVRLAGGHYSEWTKITPLALASIGILQGVTLAAAARNLEHLDIDDPIVDRGVEALFGQHPERGGPERRQAVFAVLTAALQKDSSAEPIKPKLPEPSRAFAKAYWTEELVIVASGDERAPVGTIGPKMLYHERVATLPVDGSTFDPEKYPALAEALMPLGFEPGQLPDLRGRIWTSD